MLGVLPIKPRDDLGTTFASREAGERFWHLHHHCKISVTGWPSKVKRRSCIEASHAAHASNSSTSSDDERPLPVPPAPSEVVLSPQKRSVLWAEYRRRRTPLPAIVAVEFSDAWLDAHGDIPVMECGSEFMRGAFLYSDTRRMLCGRPTIPACGRRHLGRDIVSAQRKRECLLADLVTRLPSNYDGYIVSTEQDVAWDSMLLREYILTELPPPSEAPLTVGGMAYGPFFLFTAGALRFMFGEEEGRRWRECKATFAECVRRANPVCTRYTRHSYAREQYNNDHMVRVWCVGGACAY